MVGTLVLRGAGAGLLWGALARLWMRLISTVPTFTWSGTALILGSATIAGAAVGFAVAMSRVRPGARLPRVLAMLSFLPFCIGPGLPMMLTVIGLALALARTDWPRWARVVCAACGTAAFWPIVHEGLQEPMSRVWLAFCLLLFVPLLGVLVAGVRQVLAPQAGERVVAGDGW